MKKYKAGIINVTGYAGLELARILESHPSVELCSVTGRSLAGKKLSDVFPYLHRLDLPITENLEGQVDVAFLALPHKEGAALVPALLEKGMRVIDISADFRLKDPALYQAWYGFEHPCRGSWRKRCMVCLSLSVRILPAPVWWQIRAVTLPQPYLGLSRLLKVT